MAINDIDINDPKVQRVLIIVFVGILVSGALVWFDILPTNKTLTEKIAERDTKSEKLISIKNKLDKLKNLEEKVEILKQECDSLEQMFLGKSDISTLINDLARIAARIGIKASNFKPDDKKTVHRQYYTEKKYQVTLIGGYHQIGRFLEELTKLDLILKVSDMKVEENKGLSSLLAKMKIKEFGDLEKELPSIQATFYVTTFSYRQNK